MQKSKENSYVFEIKSYHSDIRSNLSLHQLFLFLQECAWLNAQENGFGFDFVEQNNALWVLSRVYLKLDQLPKWEDEITIKTWPKDFQSIFAFRDFQWFVKEKLVGQASSSWVVLDKKTRRPRRISDFEFSNFDFLNKNACERNPEKIVLPNNMKVVEHLKVHFSDLDVNGHVNNASYVKWISDAIYIESNSQISEFEINYLRELQLNETFSISLARLEKESFVEIKNAQAKSICAARIKYR